jgi:hypothetical protein
MFTHGDAPRKFFLQFDLWKPGVTSVYTDSVKIRVNVQEVSANCPLCSKSRLYVASRRNFSKKFSTIFWDSADTGSCCITQRFFQKIFELFWDDDEVMMKMIRGESVKSASMLDREKIFPKFFLEFLGKLDKQRNKIVT